MRLFYNPINLVVVVFVVGAGLAGMTVLLDTLLPGFIRRARDHAAIHPWRSFLIGLVNLLFFGLITLALVSRPGVLKGVGVVLATILLAFLMLGASTIARLVGERLRPNDPSAPKQIIAGIVTVELAEMVPLVGWFVVPMVAAATGLGAVILALVKWPAGLVPSQDSPSL